MLGPSIWTRSWVRATRGAASLRITRGLSSAEGSLVDEAGWEYDHDVLVVGGGIVGSCLACRLAQDAAAASTGGGASQSGSSLLRETSSSPGGSSSSSKRSPSVALIEARPPPSLEKAMAREGPDPRVYSLTPSSVRLLKAVGVWDGAGVGGREAVLKGRSQPYGGMQVWDNRGPGHLRFDSEGEEGRRGPLGFISEHGIIHSALFDRVRELEAAGLAEVMCPAQVKRVSFPPVGVGGAVGPVKVTVESASGETSDVSCRLLVAADGGDSKVAKMLGLPSFGWGYGQRAVVATVRLSAPHGETAFQRYLSTGPLAMLPLKGGMMASLVWSTTPEHAERLKSMSPAGFLQEVNNALSLPPAVGTPPASASGERSGERSGEFPSSPISAALAAGARMRGEGGFPAGIVGGVPSSLAALPFAAASALGEGIARGAEGVAGALAGLSLGLEGAGAAGFCIPPKAVEVMTPRLGFDLSLRQAHRYTGERAALVGDAAHTIHPMAGQGLNLGIADADALARAVLEGRRSGTDVGSKTLLGRYEEERKTEALVMMGALDGLHRLFGADGRAVAAARSAGLSTLNAAGPLKRRLARHAMGGGT